jgi:hypothetical protein
LQKINVVLGKKVQNRIENRIEQRQPKSDQNHLIPEVDPYFPFYFDGGHLANPLIDAL